MFEIFASKQKVLISPILFNKSIVSKAKQNTIEQYNDKTIVFHVSIVYENPTQGQIGCSCD